jgi:hypothetical protein
MTDPKAARERYMRDSLPVRLGGLAANLARIKSFSSHSDHGDAVESLITQSKFFIEWTAPEAKLEVQVLLVEIQRQLVKLLRSWPSGWTDLEKRASLAEQAGQWSQRILTASGLLG